MVFKFTIDKWLNRWVPANRVERLPAPLRRVLGAHSPAPHNDYWVWLEILVASFAGIALLEGVFKSQTAFLRHHPPMIVASYGASAILCFNAVASPLAQPRNILMGHFVASVLGVCIQKLFLLSTSGRANYWASGALSVGVASVAMSLLNCVHPPAGALALLPSVDEGVRQLGWWYLPVQLVSSVLIIAVAMVTGNLIRSYPQYWWSALATGAPLRHPPPLPSLKPQPSHEGISFDGLHEIRITKNDIVVPAAFDVSELEAEWLNELQHQLKRE